MRILERLTGNQDWDQVNFLALPSVDSVSQWHYRSATDDHDHPYATDILYVH